MKRGVLLFLFTWLFYPPLFSQEVQAWLLDSYLKCQSIQSGFYEMEVSKKYMFAADTIKNQYQCYFKKVPADSLAGCVFHTRQFLHGKETAQNIYSGDTYIEASYLDSIAVLYNVSNWEDHVIKRMDEFDLFLPFTSPASTPLPRTVNADATPENLQMIGEELVSKKPAWHIRSVIRMKDHGGAGWRVVGKEIHYWLGMEDSLPLQYTVQLAGILGHDTLQQSETYRLIRYRINEPVEEKQFSESSLPAFFRLRDFDPAELKKQR